MSVKLKLLVGDTKREGIQGMTEAFRLGQRGSIALVGPLTSGVAAEVSTFLSKIPSIDRTVISYTAASRQLSGPSFSKNFLRTQPTSDTRSNVAVQLIKGMSVC